jgi:hypothetical protein
VFERVLISQYTQWLKIYSVLFYSHLRWDILFILLKEVDKMILVQESYINYWLWYIIVSFICSYLIILLQQGLHSGKIRQGFSES